jgi:hypothetical protein
MSISSNNIIYSTACSESTNMEETANFIAECILSEPDKILLEDEYRFPEERETCAKRSDDPDPPTHALLRRHAPVHVVPLYDARGVKIANAAVTAELRPLLLTEANICSVMNMETPTSIFEMLKWLCREKDESMGRMPLACVKHEDGRLAWHKYKDATA